MQRSVGGAGDARPSAGSTGRSRARVAAIRRPLLIGAIIALAVPSAAWGLVFRPSRLPAAKVGVPYRVVVHVSLRGHHPAYGKPDYPSYGVDCFGADPDGGFMDDCARLPPGIRIRSYSGPGCAPPLDRPYCLVFTGTPTAAGSYSFRLSAPDAASLSVRGFLVPFTLVVRR